MFMAQRVTALHCNLFLRIETYAYTNILCLWDDFRTPALLLKRKCKQHLVSNDDILNMFI